MQKLFTTDYDDTYNDLRKNGYTIIDFLEEEQIEQLKNIYSSQKTTIDNSTFNGIHMTTWMKEKETKYLIKNQLEAAIHSACDKLFEHYKKLNTVFIIKNKHKISNFPLHQDWSFVDETKESALNIWIALQDTTIKNGGLYIIKGSHKLRNKIRGAGKLSFDFEAYRKELSSYLSPVLLKAGQAVIFYYSCIHGSPANQTNEPRIIVATTIVPEDAVLQIHYYDENENILKKYLMNDNFTYEYNDIRLESVIQEPKGKLVNNDINYMPVHITLEEIKAVAVPYKINLFRKLLMR